MGSSLCNDADAHNLLVDPDDMVNLYDYRPANWPEDRYLMKLLEKSSVAQGEKKSQPYKHKTFERYYWGGWSNGKPNGKGIFYECEPQKILYYEGEVVGQPNGRGKLDFNRGQWVYEGQVNEGKAHGQGKMVNKKQGFTFDGQWIDSRPVKGQLILHQNNVNKQNNQKGGDIFVDFDDSRHENTIRYPDGRVYIGEIDKRRYVPHGTGKVQYPDKRQYLGQWHQGEMHGLGKYQWPDGSMYTGEYMFGKRHGNGKFLFNNGRYYDGKWSEGKQNGYGTLFSKEGQVIQKGVWKQGNFGNA